MVSPYYASWQRTERILLEAKALLLARVVEKNSADLKQFHEFLDANELGLAFDYFESITYADQPDCLPLLRLLSLAAEEMDLVENLEELKVRIDTLMLHLDNNRQRAS